MARVRLTKRMAADDNTPFPGTVGNEDRKDPKSDQYHTFEHTVNHELPDMRTEWKSNPRDEIGFGVPKVAHIWATAQKAVKLATLFLGDKCNDKLIEAQARDFMRLGSSRIEFALKRFAKTEELYKAEDEVDTEDEVKIESAESDDAVEEVKIESAESEDTKEDKKEASKKIKADEKKEDEKKEDDEKDVKAEETEEAEPKATEEEVVEASDEDETEIDMNATDEDVTMSEKDEEILSSLFAEDTNEEDNADEDVVEASSKKEGIKKLGGQPKMASKKAEDLGSLWNDAPDVSHIFN